MSVLRPVTPAFTPSLRLHGWQLATARAAWAAVALVSVGVFVVGLALGAGAGSGSTPEQIEQAGLSVAFVTAFQTARSGLFGLVYGAVGLAIFWRRSDDWMALITSLMLITFGTAASGFSYLQPLLRTLNATLFGLAIVLNGYFLCAFPDGRFVPRWTVALLAAWTALNIAPLLPWTQAITAPLLQRGGGLLVLGFLTAFVGVQAYRYRHLSDAMQRQQTRWVVVGIAAALGGYAIFRLAPWPAAYPLLYKDLLYVSLGMLALLAVPLSIGIAMLRFRLWDMDVVVNRALVYGALTVSTIGLYVLVVGYFSMLFRSEAGLAISLAATGLVAVLFEPLRARLQRGVNRMMYGERDDPATVLARLSQRLEAALAPSAALPAIVDTVTQALRLPYAAISLIAAEAEPCVAAETGQPGAELIRLPLTYQSTLVGELLLAPRSKGEALSAADLRLLGIVTQQAGVLAHNARLANELRQANADLQASRERLVTAQEEERRRLRRDLHDSVGPTLASLLQRIDTAADLVTQEPAASVAMLNALKGQVKVTLAEIRQLVYALRPPVLDEFGLVTALRAHVAPYNSPAGMRVRVLAPEPMPPLPAAVEVVAYRIALEAFTNTVRHANARACDLALKLEAAALVVEVVDDGAGLPAGVRWGVGLTAMRERAAELGGECSVTSEPGRGTRVRARLPLPSVTLAQGD